MSKIDYHALNPSPEQLSREATAFVISGMAEPRPRMFEYLRGFDLDERKAILRLVAEFDERNPA